MKWFRLAAENGHAEAQANLGAMYENGFGVERNSVLSHMWSNIACSNGSQLGASNRDRLEVTMAQHQVAQAQKYAQTMAQPLPANAHRIGEGRLSF
jgi:uncharacterized protein